MRIIGYHVSNTGIIANSDGEYTTEPPYFDFLLNPKQDALKIFYYLSQDIANLAKIAGLTLDELWKVHSGNNNKAYLPPYKLTYIPNKYFSIHKGFYYGAPFAFFANAQQYKNLPASQAKTIDNVIEKAKEAQEVGDSVYDALSAIGLHPTSLTSPIKAFEKEVLSKIDLPNANDMPNEARDFAYECAKGNWVEAYQLGHWEKAWDYDISSAYPSEMAKLYDIRLGKWIKSNYYIGNAEYGYCRGRIHINRNTIFSPFIYRQENNGGIPSLYCPVGNFATYLTKGEIDFLEKWKLGSFDIENGWWWTANKQERPLESIIKWLYLEKEKASGTKKAIIKRIMAAMFGKTIEVKHDDLGDMFNSCWGAETETNTRLEVADFVLRNSINPIHIAVDGVICPEPVLTVGEGIGEWKLANITPCICAGTGLAALRDGGVGDFHLKYDWLKGEIEKQPESCEYKMNRLNPITIGEACNGRLDKLGELQEISKVISIGQGEKRCYQKHPRNGKELLEKKFSSLPWDASLVQKEV